MEIAPSQQIINKEPYRGFLFEGQRFEPSTGTIFLAYRFSPEGPAFDEKIILGTSRHPSGADEKTLASLLRLLHVAAGISYYKAYIPREMTNASLTKKEAVFFSKFYREGLGEFAHRNNLDISNHAFFDDSGKDHQNKSSKISLPNRSLVLVGGGKDSLVSIETLREAGDDITLFAVNPAQPIKACMEKADLPTLAVTRVIDPQLFELNKTGAYNGHVPITGIISFIAAAAAIWHGYDKIVLSNERSANEATVDGVNHQYSKSQDFESAFIDLLHSSVTPSLYYVSLLRPLSEIGIAKLFAKTDRYDSVFTSCNKAYSITNPMTDKRWCGECPKCQFVYLSLATAMDPARLTAIFSRDLLNDKMLEKDYRALCGLAGQKPWECVGEILESAAALYILSKREGWKDAAIVRLLHEDLLAFYGADKLDFEYERALSFAPAPTLGVDDLKKLKRYAA